MRPVDPTLKSGEPPGPVGAGGSGERVCGAFALGQQQEVENRSHRENSLDGGPAVIATPRDDSPSHDRP